MSATPLSAVPPTREFTFVWIAYALFAAGALFWWPALVGAVLCHVKRGSAGAGFIDAHYGWLARTFWWSLLGYLLCLGVILAGAWPIVRDVLDGVRAAGGDWETAGVNFGLQWRSIFMTAGAAMVGGVGLFVVWLWYLYRLARGIWRLHDARATP